jgi:hypothetical protein
MKLKNIKKKIRLLEARLQKGEKKLGKLKRKLTSATTAGVGKTKKKSAARASEARQSVKASARNQRREGRLTAKAPVKPAGAKRPSTAEKVKRTLNLSPERRAQLAAAMKARWAAKRAAAESIPQNTPTDRDFTLQEVPQSA